MKYLLWEILLPNSISCFLSIRLKKLLGAKKLGRKCRKILLTQTHFSGYDFFDFYLTDKQAFWILCNLNLCNRELATLFKKVFKIKSIASDCNLTGEYLKIYCLDYFRSRYNRNLFTQ